MQILDLIQGSPEWLAARGRYNCASEAPVMMGASKHMKRGELIKLKATGGEKEFSDYVRKRVLDKGHASEAAARPIVEAMLGQELFPVTVTDDAGWLLASLDGQTMDEVIVFEHKEYNEALAEQVRAGELEPHYYWQLEQELLVSGAQKVVFVTSDGTAERMAHMEYLPVPGRAEQLVAGWKQFDLDVAAYVHVEEVQPATGQAVTALPAVMVQVTGSIALQDNFTAFETALRDFIGNRLIMDPKDDQDFADLDLQIKALKKAEEMLDAAEGQMLAQVSSVDQAKRTKDMLHKLARDNRLMAEKLLTARKDTIRADIVRKGQQDFAAHITALNTRLGKPYMPVIDTDFTGVVKSKRTVSSLQDAVSTELARAKIAANEVADRIDVNLAFARDHAGEYKALFADTAQLVLKPADDFQALVRGRIAEHQAKLQRDADALAEQSRDRIRREEADRLEAEQKAAQQPTAAPTPAHTAAPTSAPVAAPSPVAAAAPVGNVVAMSPRATVAPAADLPPIRLGQLNALLAPIQLTADGLETLGFKPVATEKAAKLYRAADVGLIVTALHGLLDRVQVQQAA